MAIAELPQHMTALQRANEVRLAGAAMKAKVKAGDISMRLALFDADAGSLPVLDLLMAQPRWGTDRATKLLASLSISEVTRVRDLTPRLRRVIVGVCAGAAAQQPMPDALDADRSASRPPAERRAAKSSSVVREFVARYHTLSGEPRKVVLVVVDGGDRVLFDRGPGGERVVERFERSAGLLEIAAVAQGYLAEMGGEQS